MRTDQISSIYQLVSYLLHYPSQEMVEQLDVIEDNMDDFGHAQIQDHLSRFVTIAKSTSFDEWIEHYISLFDFGKTTNLYITYNKLGEQRERGLELLKIKKLYQGAGFDVIHQELPDYLPVILEFAATAERRKVHVLLNRYYPAIQEIREKLVEAQSFYTLLFDALLMTMEEHGIYEAA